MEHCLIHGASFREIRGMYQRDFPQRSVALSGFIFAVLRFLVSFPANSFGGFISIALIDIETVERDREAKSDHKSLMKN